MLLHRASCSEIPVVVLIPATPLPNTFDRQTSQHYLEKGFIIKRQIGYADIESSRLGDKAENISCQAKHYLSYQPDKRLMPAPYAFNQSWTLVYQVVRVVMEDCCYDLAERWLPGMLRAELGARSHSTWTASVELATLIAEMATNKWPIRPRFSFNCWALFWRKYQAHLALRSATESSTSLESLLTDAWLIGKMVLGGRSVTVYDARSLVKLALKLAKAARDEVRLAVLENLKTYIDRKVIVMEVLEHMRRRKSR